jgi:quinolinate synthase
MGMNNLENLYHSLRDGSNEILVDPALGKRAIPPLQRMLEFRDRQR